MADSPVQKTAKILPVDPPVEPVLHVYRLHLVTGDKIMVSTTVDLVDQVRLEGTWVDAGQSGYVNPAHIVRIEVTR